MEVWLRPRGEPLGDALDRIGEVPLPPYILKARQAHGEPTTATFLIRDKAMRVHPSQAKRVAPDFWFHPQIYRADGETVRLPAGQYTIEFSRGPESIAETRNVTVSADTRELSFRRYYYCCTKNGAPPSIGLLRR